MNSRLIFDLLKKAFFLMQTLGWSESSNSFDRLSTIDQYADWGITSVIFIILNGWNLIFILLKITFKLVVICCAILCYCKNYLTGHLYYVSTSSDQLHSGIENLNRTYAVPKTKISPNKQSQIEKTDEHASSRKRIPYSAANIAILTDWIRLNKLNPYATTKAKLELAAKTQLSTKQITCWLINTRRSEWFKLEREEFMNSK